MKEGLGEVTTKSHAENFRFTFERQQQRMPKRKFQRKIQNNKKCFHARLEMFYFLHESNKYENIR